MRLKSTQGWHGQRVYLAGDNWERQAIRFQLFQNSIPVAVMIASGIPNVIITGFSQFQRPQLLYLNNHRYLSGRHAHLGARPAHRQSGFFVLSKPKGRKRVLFSLDGEA